MIRFLQVLYMYNMLMICTNAFVSIYSIHGNLVWIPTLCQHLHSASTVLGDSNDEFQGGRMCLTDVELLYFMSIIVVLTV